MPAFAAMHESAGKGAGRMELRGRQAEALSSAGEGAVQAPSPTKRPHRRRRASKKLEASMLLSSSSKQLEDELPITALAAAAAGQQRMGEPSEDKGVGGSVEELPAVHDVLVAAAGIERGGPVINIVQVTGWCARAAGDKAGGVEDASTGSSGASCSASTGGSCGADDASSTSGSHGGGSGSALSPIWSAIVEANAAALRACRNQGEGGLLSSPPAQPEGAAAVPGEGVCESVNGAEERPGSSVRAQGASMTPAAALCRLVTVIDQLHGQHSEERLSKKQVSRTRAGRSGCTILIYVRTWHEWFWFWFWCGC